MIDCNWLLLWLGYLSIVRRRESLNERSRLIGALISIWARSKFLPARMQVSRVRILRGVQYLYRRMRTCLDRIRVEYFGSNG